jgi:hypothetical protein
VVSNALDIDIPDSAVEVFVHDEQSKAPIPGAVVFCGVPSADDPWRRYPSLRAEADRQGVARFSAVVLSKNQEVCGSDPPAGYILTNCSKPFRLASGEKKKIDLALKKTGNTRGKLVSSIAMEPPLLFLSAADGMVRERLKVRDGLFWMLAPPQRGDYFVLTSPKQPLFILPTWTMEGDALFLEVPTVPIRTIMIRGSGTEEPRHIAVSIGGRRVPHVVLSMHLMNLRINPFSPWTSGMQLPLIAQTAAIAVTLGPPASEYAALRINGSEVFVRPEFANRLTTLVVSADHDELQFP